jgi:hypothetical protein
LSNFYTFSITRHKANRIQNRYKMGEWLLISWLSDLTRLSCPCKYYEVLDFVNIWLFLKLIFLIDIVAGGWSPIGSTRHCGHPRVGYDDREIGGMIGKGNRSTQRKPAPVPLCPPQTPPCEPGPPGWEASV